MYTTRYLGSTLEYCSYVSLLYNVVKKGPLHHSNYILGTQDVEAAVVEQITFLGMTGYCNIVKISAQFLPY